MSFGADRSLGIGDAADVFRIAGPKAAGLQRYLLKQVYQKLGFLARDDRESVVPIEVLQFPAGFAALFHELQMVVYP